MNCIDAAEFVSALCDGEIIPPAAAEHIGGCEACQARLKDYLAVGVELRRVASLESASPAPSHTLHTPQNALATWWQKGWGTMKIPRFAFALLVVAILVLTSALTMAKVRARDTGTVVLLSTAGPDGPLWDCPLSTQNLDHDNCSWFGKVGSHGLAYKLTLLSHKGNRVRLAIRTLAFSPGQDLSAFTTDSDPAAKLREVWFKPGERLKFDVPEIGNFTLTGEWMDHSPILFGPQGQDFSPGPGEIRIVDALLLKDKTIVGDEGGLSESINETDNPHEALGIYMPGHGRFLLSLQRIKGAVEANVFMGRVWFEEGGHSWGIVASAPVSRTEHIWVLHQPDFKMKSQATFVNAKLVQTESGLWEPKDMPN